MDSIAALRTTDRRLPIRPQVYNAIREAIVSAVLRPGQALSEKELAEQFNVSRTPVRESLIKLAEEGLVDVYPQVGTYVSHIKPTEVYESRFIREALECAAVREAAKRMNPEAILDLRVILDDQRRFDKSDDYDSFYVADEALHKRIIEISGYPKVWKVAQSSKVHMDRVRYLSLPVPSVMAALIKQHESIVDALERGDPEKAEQALRVHLSEVFMSVDLLLRQHPEYFT